MKLSRLNIQRSVLLICDIQEKARPVIYKGKTLIKNISILNETCHRAGIPIIVTEQYSKGLGPTISEIKIYPTTQVFDKLVCSMMSVIQDPFDKSNVFSKKQVLLKQNFIYCQYFRPLLTNKY